MTLSHAEVEKLRREHNVVPGPERKAKKESKPNRGRRASLKITDEQVIGIRELAAIGIPYPMIAKRLGVTKGYIGNIVKFRARTTVPANRQHSVDKEAS